MSIKEILLRVCLALLFSALIGYEREKSQSNAGIKTHALVGVSSALVAITQSEIGRQALVNALANPTMANFFSTDPARLTAQVISGIGFLGAGTIIVTRRSISGLTTAASIWSVACLGISVGMGYVKISVIGFLAIFSILFLLKRFVNLSVPTKLIIKYTGGLSTLDKIRSDLDKLDLQFTTIKYDVQVYGDIRLYTNIFEIKSLDQKYFDKLLDVFAHNQNIINCEKTKFDK
ncbi:MgtC/SapB family protein [Enterococcus sp. BWB1-3]|uniref:MgtC/SapB family protein n=1 Tax=unclassified Enterococcus TaxID=2608891 RepID=UPI0019207321|nr:MULTISPECIES: MgtC/SapB family protein [unclassified Enterococcus]MBL1227816.1 MgtC/SapB family protein [Enterococcus sp. BWB1-3]MCB5953308.1 MgtC/SapB family protein [Enterococcus sp. BWT-B8]